jgi:uncharacterized protein (UPF0332 family)
MTNASKKENIALEIAQAEEILKEAELLLEKGFYKGAIARTYYFVFHLVKALLFSLGLEPKSHEGAVHLFNLHFIRKDKIKPIYGKLFSRLQKYREQADYDPATVFSQADVEEELILAKRFAQDVKVYLEAHNF